MKMKILNNLHLDKTFTINTSSLFILNALNFLLTIIVLPKLINTFGIAGWGEITFAQLIINYFIWIIDWSFPQYACKQISIYENNDKKRNQFFITARTSQLILFFTSSIFLSLYGFVFSNNQLVYNYSILILFGSFLQTYWYLNGREKIYETAFIQLLNKVFFALFVFAIIKKGDDISTYFFYFGICNIITGIICTIRIVIQYNETFKIGDFNKSIRLIKKSFMLFNSAIIGNITNSSIPFIISSFYSIENLGIYNITDRIKNISIQILNPLSNSIFPKMSRTYYHDKKKANKTFLNFLLIFSLIGFFIFLILNINLDLIISYFLKEKVNGINLIARILTLSFLSNIIYESFVNQYLILNNLFKEINKIKLLVLFTTILIGIPLIYYKGILGAALTNLTYEITGLIFAINSFIKTKNKKYFSY